VSDWVRPPLVVQPSYRRQPARAARASARARSSAADQPRARARRRAFSPTPPQMPNSSPCSSAHCRHSARTGQPAQIAACVVCESPRSGNHQFTSPEWRQAAALLHDWAPSLTPSPSAASTAGAYVVTFGARVRCESSRRGSAVLASDRFRGLLVEDHGRKRTQRPTRRSRTGCVRTRPGTGGVRGRPLVGSRITERPSSCQRDHPAQNDGRPIAIYAPITGVPCSQAAQLTTCRSLRALGLLEFGRSPRNRSPVAATAAPWSP
jgi:hypothetical protein